MEYKLEVQRRGQPSRLIRDPLNPQLAHDPFGANSVCQGAELPDPDWIGARLRRRVRARSRRSCRQRARSGATQEVQVYLPARFRTTRRYPLLVVHDGADYLRFSRAAARCSTT